MAFPVAMPKGDEWSRLGKVSGNTSGRDRIRYDAELLDLPLHVIAERGCQVDEFSFHQAQTALSVACREGGHHQSGAEQPLPGCRPELDAGVQKTRSQTNARQRMRWGME